MAFKRSTGSQLTASDPVQLYRKLAESNNGPESLWLHQGDVLRSWNGQHRTDADVAIELPTGAGKTLVGGLIADFVRRSGSGKRVAYLCPTRQLAQQTSERLHEYGIPVVLLTGSSWNWNPAERSRYTTANAVAVSVYSHVFNSNPAINDAELLLLDDAHAAESAVAGPWSLSIDRDHQDAVYGDILSAIAPALDPLVLTGLRADTAEGPYRNTVHLASPIGVAENAAELEDALTAAEEEDRLSRDARYAYRFLRGRLDRCLVYLSYRSILIRPLIAPTSTHGAFADPAQRVYMSATLGNGGELERIFGRRSIQRIPIPEGWEKQGTGRRLFCFPQLTSDLSIAGEASVDRWVSDTIKEHGRAVILTPDFRTADTFQTRRLPNGYTVLNAKDVEDDLTAFTRSENTALLLSNRYDGIDLPDDDCRLVVLAGLPARGDLQERFLHASLGAVEVLQERIRARIAQGSGRATRNARDFAAVIALDNDLVTYINRSDVTAAMHPELQAEIRFGYEYSIDVASQEMNDNLKALAAHTAEWQEAEQDLLADRETLTRVDAPGAVELQRSVRSEVDACDAIWQGEWDRALDATRNVLDDLRGGRAPQRYAALWNYLAACICHRRAQRTGDASYREAAAGYYEAARAAGRGTTWLSHLAAPAETTNRKESATIDPVDRAAMEGVQRAAAKLAKPAAFDPAVARARAALVATPSRAYEEALVTLGSLAGADPSLGDSSNDSAPDAVWAFANHLWVAWEAKSEAKPGGELGAGDVRQAGGHLRFTASQRQEAIPGPSFVVLVAPQRRTHPSARAVAEDHVYKVTPDDVTQLFDRLARAWRAARSRSITTLTVEELAAIFQAEGALPTQWTQRLQSLRVSDPT